MVKIYNSKKINIKNRQKIVNITKYYECKTCLELHNVKEPCPFDK